jgi:hypothetical protein
MARLKEGIKEPYSREPIVIISLALKVEVVDRHEQDYDTRMML